MSGPSFLTCELDYYLPEGLIAQEPPQMRSASRLLVVERTTGKLTDSTIEALPGLLDAGDALVLNDSRVLPAKFTLRRATGGRIEGLYLSRTEDGAWDVLLKGAQRLDVGETLVFESGTLESSVLESGDESCDGAFEARVVSREDRGHWLLAVAGLPEEVLEKVGRMPLPPYIKRSKGHDARDVADRERYQTVYADKHGAVAAPTAGLHFTETLLDSIARRGVSVSRVSLHVGYGTFAPLEVDDLRDHTMHVERYEMGKATGTHLRQVRAEGGRVVAVGTTSARVLETAWVRDRWAGASSGTTDLFCYPPYELGGIDVLLTNFHLPRSTLLALVMSMAGVALIRKAYAHAVAEGYRFYSYGDAMLIR